MMLKVAMLDKKKMKKRNRVRARLPTRHLRLGDVRDGSRVTHHLRALWRCGRFVLWCFEAVQSRIKEKKNKEVTQKELFDA